MRSLCISGFQHLHIHFPFESPNRIPSFLSPVGAVAVHPSAAMAKRRCKKKPAHAGRPSSKGDAATLLPDPLVDDVAELIFHRLPLRSLAVSRCVAPSWNRLLCSAAFAARYHAARAAGNTAAPRLLSVPLDPNHHQHIRDAAPGAAPAACVDCPRVFCGAGKACHGVVLVGRLCVGEFYACNPTTGGVLRLPPRRSPSSFHSAGLGYDAKAGVHKAVLLERALVVPRRGAGAPTMRCSAVVVTVGAPQWRWREPRGTKPPVVRTKMDPVFAGGRLNWILPVPAAAQGTRQGLTGILSFVLSNESFRRIPPPPFAATDAANGRAQPPTAPPEHATLAELDGRLCLLRDLRSRRHAVALFELWRLHDFESMSWSFDCRIDLTLHIGRELTWPWSGDISLLGYVGGDASGHSRKMLLATTMQMAYTYDLDTGELRTVAWRAGILPRDLRLVLHHESVLHLAGMEYGEKDIKFTDCESAPDSNDVTDVIVIQ
ncbi:hypothetical protein ACP70R_027256 [Stipagrostis hirtigluma subsp. patula]